MSHFEYHGELDIDPDRVANLDNSYFMSNDLAISCASSRYGFGVVWGIFMIIIYPIGMPALYYLILYANKEDLIDKDRVSTESTDAKASLIEYLENSVPFDNKDLLGLLERDPTMTKEKMLRFLIDHNDITKSSLTALIITDDIVPKDAKEEEEETAYERARESIASQRMSTHNNNMKDTLDALGETPSRDELIGIIELDEATTKADVLQLYSSGKSITDEVLINYITANSGDEEAAAAGYLETLLQVTRTYARPKDMSFLHASYEGRTWYWELVETYR
jgi:hypothetical protein